MGRARGGCWGGGTEGVGALIGLVPKFLDIGGDLLGETGLWRSWNPEWKTEERQYDGAATPSIRTTINCYATNKQGGSQFGNRTHLLEYDRATSISQPLTNCEQADPAQPSYIDNPVRITRQDFKPYQTATSYIVDRPAQDAVMNGSMSLLALTERFYDDQLQTYGGINGYGDLTLVRAYKDVTAGSPFLSNDTRYHYDAYGNRDETATFSDWGIRTFNATTITWSSRATNANARIMSTNYEIPPSVLGRRRFYTQPTA